MMTKTEIAAGTRVEGGMGEDHDAGTVIAANGVDLEHPMAGGDNVFVAWDSGVRTWVPVTELS